MDDGSRSACNDDVEDEDACEQLCVDGGWDRALFFDSDCACEPPKQLPGWPEVTDLLPVSREADANDLDGDNNRIEIIRWRYVVVILAAKCENNQCKEKHQMRRCWCDDNYN